jgi:rare lipoprotein A
LNQNQIELPDYGTVRKNQSAQLFVILSVVLIFQSCSVAPRYVTKHHEEKSKIAPPTAKKSKLVEEKKKNSKENKSDRLSSDENAEPAKNSETSPQKLENIFQQTGLASYYANKFQGHRTANGERYNMRGFTAAHLTLPFNTKVKITNLNNNLSVIVRINDRGPHSKSRIIDLSRAAAEQIGLIRQGICKVRIEIVE